MSIPPLSTTHFRQRFGEMLDSVKNGETVVITNHAKRWVEITPPDGQKLDKVVTAFDLRNNMKEYLDTVHHTNRAFAVKRKGEIVAVIRPCST